MLLEPLPDYRQIVAEKFEMRGHIDDIGAR